MLLSIILLTGVALGQDHVVQDTFWYRPEYLADKIFLYVEQFIVDSLDTCGTVLQCYTYSIHRLISTKKYLNTFHSNQIMNFQSFRPFGALELSGKLNADGQIDNSNTIRIKVQDSFWIQLMFHKFNMSMDFKEGLLTCRQIYMSIRVMYYEERYCGMRRPWDQVR